MRNPLFCDSLQRWIVRIFTIVLVTGVSAAVSGCGGGGGGTSGPSGSPPSNLSYTSPVSATVGVALLPVSPTVTGTVTGYSVSPALPPGLSLSTASGVISGTPTAVIGQATYSVTATNSYGNTSFPLVLTVNPPPPAAVTIINGNNQSGAVGAALPISLAVRVDSAGAQPLAGATVTWTVATGGGALSQTSTTTAADGTTSVKWTIGTKSGTNTVMAESGSVQAVTFTATGTPGPVVAIMLTNPKNPLATGDVIKLTAAGVDNYGNAALPPSLAWVASPASVATIDQTGTVTAVAPGGGFVTANEGSVSATLPIVVNGNITFVIGPEEIVFRYATDSCIPGDNPDVNAKAVRLADGSLMIVSGDGAPQNYALFGPDFSSLRRSCTTPTLVGALSPNPDTFANDEWVWSPYREGSTIHALIHNEFHDPVAPNCSPGDPNPGNPCWYNSILYASSSDGGHTYTQAAAPAQVIAPPPVQWNPGPPTPNPHGYFAPSNIVLNADGFYYSVFMSIDTSGHQGMCVMRTQTLGNPASWRSWDGSGFNLQMIDPYTGPQAQWCTQVITGGLPGSLTYNTYLGQYMLVTDFATPIGCGTAFVTSVDLLHWSPVQWMRAAYYPFPGNGPAACLAPSGTPGAAYASIVDHADTTINFERPGQAFYLYYTRFNNGPGPDRDLARVPVVMTLH